MIETIFVHISWLLGLTVGIAFVVRWLRQPLIVAYIIAGLIAGPLFLNIVNSDTPVFGTLAHFGIVLLLFVIGLNFNVEYLRRMGRLVFAGGAWQFVITALVGFGVLRWFNFSALSAGFVAVAITFSSTIIIVKLLDEKRHTETAYGQYVIGLLVVQDVIAVLLLIALNAANLPGTWQMTLVAAFGKAILLGSAVYLISTYILPSLLRRAAPSSELLFIFTIAWCFVLASLVYAAGFGAEIGAVIAGLTLGSSPYQAEISSRLRPLRDFFIVLFFIVLGSELQLGEVLQVWRPGLALALFVLVVEPIILYIVMRRMGYQRRNAFLAGVTAAQVSEFGFILIFKGKELGYVQGPELALLTLVALTTIVISSYLITYNEELYARVRPWLERFGKDHKETPTEEVMKYQAWVFGYHRMGWKICQSLRERGISFAVVDFSPSAIEKLKARGIPAYFGDASDVEFLETLSLGQAEMIISTIPDAPDQLALIRFVRKHSPHPIIITHLQHARHLSDLYAAGADYVMLTHLLGGQWIAERLAEPLARKNFAALRKEQKQEMKLRFDARV